MNIRTIILFAFVSLLGLSLYGQNTDRVFKSFDLFYVDNSPLGFGGESLSEQQVLFLENELNRKSSSAFGHFMLFISNADNFRFTFRRESIKNTLALLYQQTEPMAEGTDKYTLRRLIFSSAFIVTDTLNFHFFSTGLLFDNLTNTHINKLKLVGQLTSQLSFVLSENTAKPVPVKIFLYPPPDYSINESKMTTMQRKLAMYFPTPSSLKGKVSSGKTKEGVSFFSLTF